MARRFFAASFLIAVSLTAHARAQDRVPAVDVFGGYSYLPANGDDFPRQASHGLQAGVAVNLNRWFGVAAEFGQQRDTTRFTDPNFEGLVAESTVREYLVGPRFTSRGRRVNGFAHGWIGRAVGDAGETFSGFSDSGLMVGGGAGVDVAVTPRLAVRGQYDWLGSFTDIIEANSRFAVGAVVGFGRR